jgi:hypothetical protein
LVVQHRHARKRSRLAAPAAAGLLFLATVIAGAFLLPARVDMYYTPTDRPDVTYALWQYLTLAVAGAAIVAVALSGLARAAVMLVEAFARGPATSRPDVAVWVSAWVLVWSASTVWLAIWFGNEHPEERSWLELVAALAGLSGVLALVGARARQDLRRNS